MATDIKGRRSHEGRGGQARTRLARRAVIQAARVLFLEHGYAATTIEAISEESDVPPATVYRLFSSKLGILKALLDVSIAGDDEAVPLQNRPHARALFDDPDPRNQLSGFAGITGGIMSRAEPVYRILVSAAGSIPTQPLCWPGRRGNGTRAKNRSHVPWPGPCALRPGLRERAAADIIHALMSPEVYRLLVGDRGWPPQRYEQWLKDVLTGQLLPPPTTGGGRTDPSPGRTAGEAEPPGLTGPRLPRQARCGQ